MDAYVAPRTRLHLRKFGILRAVAIAPALALFFFLTYEPEVLSQTTDRVSAQQSQEGSATAQAAAIKSKVNEVLVPVIVRDAQGHSIDNLSRDDFQVFDNGKQQTITGFTVVKRGNSNAALDSSGDRSNSVDAPAVPEPASSPQRVVAFLFDDLNLNESDLAPAQQSAIRALDATLSPADVAVVLSTSGLNSGVTRDHEKLKQTILKLRAKSFLRTNENECHNINYYMGDQIANKADVLALQAASIETMHCFTKGLTLEAAESIVQTGSARAVELGEQNYRANLGAVKLILTKLMKPLPGQHILVVISPGFYAPTAEAAAIQSEIEDLAARSNTIIDTIDARGLHMKDADAAIGRKLDQSSQRLLDQYRNHSREADSSVMVELADGTGGTFYHNNNDLEGGFKTLLAGAECRYLLAFSPAKLKPRVRHSLKVRVNDRSLKVQARSWYSMPTPEKHKGKSGE